MTNRGGKVPVSFFASTMMAVVLGVASCGKKDAAPTVSSKSTNSNAGIFYLAKACGPPVATLADALEKRQITLDDLFPKGKNVVFSCKGILLSCGGKEKNALYDLIGYERDENGRICRNFRAKTAELVYEQDRKSVLIKMRDVRIEMPDKDKPEDVSKTTYVNAEYYPVRIDLGSIPWDQGP
jgi:hypothetical protein